LWFIADFIADSMRVCGWNVGRKKIKTILFRSLFHPPHKHNNNYNPHSRWSKLFASVSFIFWSLFLTIISLPFIVFRDDPQKGDKMERKTVVCAFFMLMLIGRTFVSHYFRSILFTWMNEPEGVDWKSRHNDKSNEENSRKVFNWKKSFRSLKKFLMRLMSDWKF
jgi:hypothetical protein